MKFKNINELLALRSLLLCCLILFYMPAISACQSKDLSRSQAQKMIIVSDDYKQIITLDYINRYLKEDGKGAVEAIASDELEDSAIRNRINEYFLEEPRVQIANYLGLVEPHHKRLNDQPKRNSTLYKYGFWYFDEKWTNTAKGERLWSDYNLPVQETVVPLAKKEFLSVTGLTKLGESQTGVDFTWKWVPNELGKYLDSSTADFKSLPENIRKNLTENIYKVTPDLKYEWGGERAGRAIFRRFDDGWRLESVTF